jgi:SHS2 domain-containing protein
MMNSNRGRARVICTDLSCETVRLSDKSQRQSTVTSRLMRTSWSADYSRAADKHTTYCSIGKGKSSLLDIISGMSFAIARQSRSIFLMAIATTKATTIGYAAGEAMKQAPTERDRAPDFEVVEHTADWALRIHGRDLKQLFTNAARGMASLLVADPSHLATNERRQLDLEAFDTETLLVDWLGELAFLAEEEQLVFHQFELREMSDRRLSAVIVGGRAERLDKHIKAVTYHNLEIVTTDTGLTATVVFDV